MIHQSSERVSEAAEIKTGTQFHLSATILTHTHIHKPRQRHPTHQPAWQPVIHPAIQCAIKIINCSTGGKERGWGEQRKVLTYKWEIRNATKRPKPAPDTLSS